MITCIREQQQKLPQQMKRAGLLRQEAKPIRIRRLVQKKTGYRFEIPVEELDKQMDVAVRSAKKKNMG